MPLESEFLDYLRLQGTDDLVTKSELISRVREEGYKISDRQLTFYITEGLLPKSVRVGSRAGVYPDIIVELLEWTLRIRDGGIPIEVIKELLPVWKFLVAARKSKELRLDELEYVARNNVTSTEGSMQVPMLVVDVMDQVCAHCQDEIQLILKNGESFALSDHHASVGFAIARRFHDEDENTDETRWYAHTRLQVVPPRFTAGSSSTVFLGVAPGEDLPEIKSVERERVHAHRRAEEEEDDAAD